MGTSRTDWHEAIIKRADKRAGRPPKQKRTCVNLITEDKLQKSIIAWCMLAKINNIKIVDYILHIPNGGKRKKKEAVKFKYMGLRPGVSDLFFAFPTKKYAGLWVELKVGNSKPTKLQQYWLEKMSKVGFYCAVCYSIEEFIFTINNYLKSY